MSDITELDQRYVWHPFTAMKAWCSEPPLVIARGEGNELIDENGRRYLDGVSSLWVNVHGHNRREINDAIRAQLDCIAHSTLLGLASPPAARLAEALARRAPGSLNRVFYSDSGSTAVEIALKQAYQYWSLRGAPEKNQFVFLDRAYHGDTLGAVGVGGIPVFHEVFGPLLRPGLRAPSPAACGPNRDLGPDRALALALAGMERLLNEQGSSIAAVILEPLVQGAAGMWMHPPGYLRAVAALCKKFNVLLIVDEVAVGFGRTGTMFACSQEQVVPDFLCVAKGITGGYLPLAATLATDEIFEEFRDQPGGTFFHGHTYTGNPLACAAALASLELFERDDTLANVAARSRELGALLHTRLGGHPRVGEIRQRGLMVGVELVSQRDPWTPFHVERRAAAAICRAVRDHGVILRNLDDVIVLMPPLSVTAAEVTRLVDALATALEGL